MLAGLVNAQAQGLDVAVQQFFLALVLLGKQLLDDRWIDAQQVGKCTDVNDVLEQLPLTRLIVGFVGDARERHAQRGQIFTKLGRRHRPGRVVEHVAARADLFQVFVPGLRVHRHDQIDATAPTEVTAAADPHFVPGRQALNVAWKNIAGADRDPHPEDGPGKQFVGRGRPRPVDVGELDDEIVDCVDTHELKPD